MKTYTKAQLAEILVKHKKWLASEEGGERANLRYADLSSANLRYADLSSANLSSANLSSADLRYANLSNADLSSADLSDADLSYADLSYADIGDADFSDADIGDADFSDADLSELRSLCDTIGNGSEIKTVQTNIWLVTYTATQVQIGRKLNSIEQWWNFSDEEIAQMDKSALDWWRVWKPILKQIIAVSPAVTSAAVDE